MSSTPTRFGPCRYVLPTPDRFSPCFEVEVDQRRAFLMAKNDDRGPFGHPDREGVRLVDEVLIPAKLSVHVTGKGVRRFVLLANRSRDGETAVGQRDADGDADPHARVDKAQQQAERQDHKDARASTSAATPAPPRPPRPPLVAHSLAILIHAARLHLAGASACSSGS